jgi:chitin synthase
MLQFAGQDLTNYFPIPMTIACPTLVTSTSLSLMRANFTPLDAYAVHTSGPEQTAKGTKLDDINWYQNELQPTLDNYYKGSYVMDKNYVSAKADSDSRWVAVT